jgi:nucleoside 2-deoxyribosyltransferase
LGQRIDKPRLFITATFQGAANQPEIERLCALARTSGFDDFCFVRDIEAYQHLFDDPHTLMQRARQEIEQSDALLIDATSQPTGRAIEAGIAYALDKPVILILRKGTPFKDTLHGIAFAIIEYETLEDIVVPLASEAAKFQQS